MARRILFYSHDTMGLGHIRRTLSIAGRLTAASTEVTALILTGSPVVQTFRLPRSVDYIKLPSLRKVNNSSYEPRRLQIERDDLFDLRSEIIQKTFDRYRPHIFMVDKVPSGVYGELMPTLEKNRIEGSRTHVILGLRDILDRPEVVIRDWKEKGTYEIIDQYYDRILVWGMKEICDTVTEYRFPPSIARKVSFCGYIRRPFDRAAVSSATPPSNGKKLVLATAGGGEDGLVLLKTFIESLSRVNSTFASVVILGPDMPESSRARIRSLAGPGRRNLFVIDYTRQIDRFLSSANLVVSMGGYNSVCEIVSNRKKMILVPRVTPRTEQLIRARHMERLGLARVIHPDGLSPETLALEIDRAIASPDLRGPAQIDFNGLERAIRLLAPSLRLSEEYEQENGKWEEAAS